MLLLILYVNPIYLRILFYWATKLWALRRNKCENVHYWITKKIYSKKNFKLIFSGNRKYIYIYIVHDTIQCLKNVVHSNEMACRKMRRLGLNHIRYFVLTIKLLAPPCNFSLLPCQYCLVAHYGNTEDEFSLSDE